MRHLASLLAVVLAACTPFDPSYGQGIACGPAGECPPGLTCQAGTCTHAGDGDGGISVCPAGRGHSFEPGTDFALRNAVGASMYTPTCDPNPVGSESFFYVDLVDVPAHTDFVVDVEDAISATTGMNDAVIDISSACTPATSLLCENDTVEGAGEVAVLPNATSGRLYVTIDSGSHARAGDGMYRVRMFTRPVVDAGSTCAFDLVANRCAAGSFCVNDHCGTPLQIAESEPNDGCAGASTKITGDAVITGLTSYTDPDTFELAPPTDVNVRAIIYRASDGGCPQDLRVVLKDDTCTEAASGDDNGLGGCGFFELATPLDHTKKHYLEVRVGGAQVTAPVPYTVVLDFDWH